MGGSKRWVSPGTAGLRWLSQRRPTPQGQRLFVPDSRRVRGRGKAGFDARPSSGANPKGRGRGEACATNSRSAPVRATCGASFAVSFIRLDVHARRWHANARRRIISCGSKKQVHLTRLSSLGQESRVPIETILAVPKKEGPVDAPLAISTYAAPSNFACPAKTTGPVPGGGVILNLDNR